MNLAPNLSYAPIKAVDTEYTVAKLGKCPHGVKLKSGLFGGKETKCPKCEHELSLKIKLADLDMKMKEQKHAMELKEKELQLRKAYNTEFSLDLETVNGRPPPRRLNTLTIDEVVVLLNCMKMPIDPRVIHDNLIDGNMLSVVEKMEDLADMGIHLNTLKCKVLFYNVMTFKTEGVAAHYLTMNSPAPDNNHATKHLSVSTVGSLTEAEIASHIADSLHSRPLPMVPEHGGFLSSTASSTPQATPRVDGTTSSDSFATTGSAAPPPAFSPVRDSRSQSPTHGVNVSSAPPLQETGGGAATALNPSSVSSNNLLKMAIMNDSPVTSAVPTPAGPQRSAAQRELLRENSTASVASDISMLSPVSLHHVVQEVKSSSSASHAMVRPPVSPIVDAATPHGSFVGVAEVPPPPRVSPASTAERKSEKNKSAENTPAQSVKKTPAPQVPRLQLSKDTASIEGPPKREMPARRRSEQCVSLNNTPRIVTEPQLLNRSDSLKKVENITPRIGSDLQLLKRSDSVKKSAEPANLFTSLGSAISGIFTDVSCPAVIEITSSATVIEALKILIATPTDELFWETVRNTLRDIYALVNNNRDSLKAVVKLNAVQLTADVMYLYKKELEIVKSALTVLQLMSNELAYQKLFGQTMISELLIECLDTYNKTPEVVSSVCAIFKNITANDNHNNIILLDGGGVCILLVDLLTQYKNNAALCLDILNAVRNISIYEHSTKFLGKLGICELVVEVLRLHKMNGNIVSAVCKVVKHIAVDEGNELMLGSEGIAEVFVDILKLYKNHDVVTAKVCGAIVDVSFSAVNQVRFGAAGICDMLVNILKRYQGKEVVVEIACGTIKNIAVNNENEKQFGRVGACEVLTDLLRMHCQSEVLVTAICAAIKNITFDDENRVRFGQAGACELLLELAGIHKHNERIRAAVKNLRANAENKKRFQALGLK